MHAQMQLDDFLVTRLHIDWRPPTKKTVDIGQLSSSFDYDVAVHTKDKKMFKLDLRLSFSEVGKQQAEVGYIIEANLVGLFSFPPESSQETREKLVRVNGVSMLYSTFRGILAGITGSFPGGKLSLPSIMPAVIVQEIENRKRAQVTAPLVAESEKV